MGAELELRAKGQLYGSLLDLHSLLEPWANGFAFSNFIDRSLPDGIWEWAYYGQNFQRL